MAIKQVGVLRGGTGKHYESSLHKGGEIIAHIFENLSDKYEVTDILIDKEGIWHLNGRPIVPVDLMHRIDAVWNTSGQPGLSMALDSLSIPNVLGEYFFGIFRNNNDILKTHLKNIGIKMPKSIISPQNAREVFEKFSSPWIVKINNEIKLVKTFPELVDAIEDGVTYKKSILVEEFILGKVFSIHSLTGFRGEKIYVFPPENFLTDEKEKITDIVRNLHKHLDIKHYLKSDFILHAQRGFFLTGIDSSPDLRRGFDLEQSCKHVGAEIHHIIEHILKRILEKRT